jgi:hypothetical protein
MTTNDFTNHQLEVCYNIASIAGIISLFCSLSTIAIILKMKKISGYVWLVLNLAITTTCIDIGQIMYSGMKLETDEALCQTSGVLLLFGNMAAGLWTVAISLSVACIVIKTMKLNITANIYYIATFCTAIPLSLTLAALFKHEIVYTQLGTCFLEKGSLTAIDVIYNTIHYLYFISDIILYFIIWYNIYRMRSEIASGKLSIRDLASGGFKQFDFRSSIFEFVDNFRNSMRPTFSGMNNALGTPTTLEAAGKRKLNAVEVLVSRLIWYPVVLIVIEIFRDLDRGGPKSNFAIHLLHLLTNASQGTAYFIIFLMMQPKAYKIYVNLLTCAYYDNESSSSAPQSMAPSFHVSWNNNTDITKSQLRSSLVTNETAETSALLNELDEDDLADQVKANDDLIQETLRCTMESIRQSDISRISEIGTLNSIRITDTNNINL